MKGNSLRLYLEDPFLKSLMADIRAAGPIRSSLLDITHKCNLRCTGCYFFMEQMDLHRKAECDTAFQEFVSQELERSVNMLTIVGGEPALEIDRLRTLAKHFKLTVVTNGTIQIPKDGLENIRIAVSFWGDEKQDIIFRGNGKKHILDQALVNYRNDNRAGFYYTVIPSNITNVATSVQRIIDNGNYVTFSFYSDLAKREKKNNRSSSFRAANQVINVLRQKFPKQIVSSPYLNEIVAERRMLDKHWGYAVCPSITYDHPENTDRVTPAGRHPAIFRAYNADLKTTRRCCIGNTRSCDTCTDIWSLSGWIVGSMKQHLKTRSDFINWLCTTYLFYLQTGFIDLNEKSSLLPAIYQQMNTSI